MHVVATSPEAKARATAAPLARAAGVHPLVEPLLREVDGRAWADDYERAVARYLATGAWPGWEPARDATARICAALDELAENEGDVCAVSHGLVLALYVSALTGSPADLAAWRTMPLPAIAVVEGRTATPFASVDAFLSR